MKSLHFTVIRDISTKTTMHYKWIPPEWGKCKRKLDLSIGANIKPLEVSCTLDGKERCASTFPYYFLVEKKFFLKIAFINWIIHPGFKNKYLSGSTKAEHTYKFPFRNSTLEFPNSYPRTWSSYVYQSIQKSSHQHSSQ